MNETQLGENAVYFACWKIEPNSIRQRCVKLGLDQRVWGGEGLIAVKKSHFEQGELLPFATSCCCCLKAKVGNEGVRLQRKKQILLAKGKDGIFTVVALDGC